MPHRNANLRSQRKYGRQLIKTRAQNFLTNQSAPSKPPKEKQEEQDNEVKESLLIQRLVSLLVQGRLTVAYFPQSYFIRP